MTAERGRGAARLYVAVFAIGAVALVCATIWGPAWSGPLVLACLGLLSAAAPRVAGTGRSVRRTSLVATVLGLALLARALGWL
jgi:hypothetical protein